MENEKKTASQTFTLDEIVDFTKENLTWEMSMPIQIMLFSLLEERGCTDEERAKVASIAQHFKRGEPHQLS